MDCNVIVVGYDGSKWADAALEAAAGLVADGGIVHVVTAHDEPSIRMMNEFYSSVPAEYHDSLDLLAEPRSHLRRATARLDELGVRYDDHFVADNPASAILDVADAVDADLVVVGSRGLGMATRFLRGSVSAKVANHARTSFLVVNPD